MSLVVYESGLILIGSQGFQLRYLVILAGWFDDGTTARFARQWSCGREALLEEASFDSANGWRKLRRLARKIAR